MRIRHDVSVFILLLALLSYIIPMHARAQRVATGKEVTDQYRYSMAVVKAVLAQPEGMHSTFAENPLARLGDSASVAIIKLVPAQQMDDPHLTSQLIHIMQLAFARPCIIDLDVDKTPNATLLLIKSLQSHVKDAELSRRLEALLKTVTSVAPENCRDAVE